MIVIDKLKHIGHIEAGVAITSCGSSKSGGLNAIWIRSHNIGLLGILTMTKPLELKNILASVSTIDSVIRSIRGQRVILAVDLARIYGVQTKALNQAVKRNAGKFPPDFMFQLTAEEAGRIQVSRSQIVTLKRGTNIKYLPYAFTEHGVVMAANVLNSEQAVTMSVYVVRAFVKLREILADSKELASKLEDLERKLTGRQDVHEKAILQLFSQIRKLLTSPPTQPEQKRKQIGFRPKALRK